MDRSHGRAVDGTLPKRIVCTSSESVDILIRLGCASRIVGRPAECQRREVARAVDVGGFGGTRVERILALKPDLVLTYSDMQGAVAAELIRAHQTVLAMNQGDLAGILDAIRILGAVTGQVGRAEAVSRAMKRALKDSSAGGGKRRPRVYFEEWNRPLVTATRWVSEMINLAGGRDVFAEKSHKPHYLARKVLPEEVIAADPEIIFASWCGNSVDVDAIRKRPGWGAICAVAGGRIYPLPGEAVLQAGPAVVDGVRRMRQVICQAGVSR